CESSCQETARAKGPIISNARAMNQRTDIVKSLIISSPLPNFPMERALAELGRALVFEALSPEPGDLRSNRRLDSSRHLYSPSRHRALRFDHRNRDRLEYFASGRDPRSNRRHLRACRSEQKRVGGHDDGRILVNQQKFHLPVHAGVKLSFVIWHLYFHLHGARLRIERARGSSDHPVEFLARKFLKQNFRGQSLVNRGGIFLRREYINA